MTIYSIGFRSDAESASYDLEAKTPEQALALTRQLLADEPGELWVEPYDVCR